MRVYIRWITKKGYVDGQEATLVDYEQPVQYRDGEPVDPDFDAQLKKQGFVVLQDAGGIFLVHMNQIIEFRPL